MKLHSITAVALAGALALTATACSSESGNTPTERGDLTIGSVIDVGTWAAADSAWGNAALFHTAVYDTLLRTAADGTIEPGLATEWSYDDSQTQLTLKLRDDVVFSDGENFTAEVAAENLLRFREGASENAGNLASVESVTPSGEDSVVLDLSQPDPALLTYLSQNSGLQASPASLDAPDAQVNPVGSGPYVLDAGSSIVGSQYVLTARDDYWDPTIQHYANITINVYTDATALLNALKGGQLDYANLNSTSQIPDAEAAGYTTHMQDVNWKGLILADREGAVEEPLGDVRVRQAINYALDRPALLQAIESGYGEPTTQIFGTRTDAYDPELEDAYPYDPKKARELLAEAGYPDGVTLVMPQSQFTPASDFELLAGMLGESGINVQNEQVGPAFIGDLLGGKWGSFSFGLNQEPLSWMTYRLAVAPDSAWNVNHVVDPTIESLSERMRLGGDDGSAAAKELNQYLVEQAWFAPINRVKGVLVTNDRTDTTPKVGQAVPNLWDISPAS